ncbi:MAG TPA: GNAT family protein [Mycobacteriales bacterium]|nr:GNAT family protein [Mycobacteriales bacterium]
MAIAPGGRSLVGRHVRLDPATPEDAPGLFAALDDERVWAAGYAGGPSARPTSPAGWEAVVAKAAADERAMFTVRLIDDGRIVGTSSLGDVELGHDRVHLGWTAYAPVCWGTAVNPECKLLLLGYAFDDCGFGRVKIQTDLINLRSQAAIAKLGATREGVLRRHMRRPDGSYRDTVVFAVLVDDWPAVRTGLEARLQAPAGR